MLLFFYRILFIPFFSLSMRIASLFNSKIKKGVAGRKNLFEGITKKVAGFDKNKTTVWFHSSSLGEFEQAKPIIENLKNRGEFNIFVTFFSPSGYENSVKYPHADAVTYLPLDSGANAKKFVKLVSPKLAIFMRYDIWPNHVLAVRSAGTPVLLVDATMREDSARRSIFFRSFHKMLFANFNLVLTVSSADLENFRCFGLNDDRLLVSGDTRFDRVFTRAAIAKEKNLINARIFAGKKVMVAGSTWEEDEEVLLPSVKKLLKYFDNVVFILVPHEPTLLHLEKLENEFAGIEPTIRFSFLNSYNNERIIIVDSIGILLTLYSYADIAFVGGSFKSNVHNTLEAAVYGIPVVFGPKTGNSQEAGQLVDSGGGFIVRTKKEMYKTLRSFISEDAKRIEAGNRSRNFVEGNTGATKIILEKIDEVLKLR